MDKKSKVFFVVFGLLIVASVATTYWRIVIKKDYIIEAQADCDPATEQCFVWQCDPESDVEGEKCTGEAEKDVWNYKIVRRNASRVPLCDPNDENCQALVCGENEPECEVTYCSEENKAEQEVECSVASNTAETVENPEVVTEPVSIESAEATTTLEETGVASGTVEMDKSSSTSDVIE